MDGSRSEIGGLRASRPPDSRSPDSRSEQCLNTFEQIIENMTMSISYRKTHHFWKKTRSMRSCFFFKSDVFCDIKWTSSFFQEFVQHMVQDAPTCLIIDLQGAQNGPRGGSNIGPTWRQLGPILAQHGPKLGPMALPSGFFALGPLEVIPGFPRTYTK